jgi:hypothetical protein
MLNAHDAHFMEFFIFIVKIHLNYLLLDLVHDIRNKNVYHLLREPLPSIFFDIHRSSSKMHLH